MIPTSLTRNYLGIPIPQSAPGVYGHVGTTPGETLVGAPNADNWFISAGGGSTLIGGGGSDDDTFIVADQNDKVVVRDDATGVSTIVAWSSYYALPANVDVLDLQSGSGAVGVANGEGDLLIAEGPAAYTLVAGAGNDVLVGNGSGSTLDTGAGSTRFIVAADGSKDVISNFRTHIDRVQLNGGGAPTTFAAVKAAMTQVGADVVLALGGGGSLTFRNETVGQFSAGDFLLPVSKAGLSLVFDDEFNTFLSSPDGSVGWASAGLGGNRTLPSNHEAEYYSDTSVGANPFKDTNGVLSITAAPAAPGSNPFGLPYTSGVLGSYTSFSMQYGYIEVSAKLPAGDGMWPAIWMLPENGSWPPELDIMEMLGNDTSSVYVGTHSAVGGPNVGTTTKVYVGDTTTSFHTYAVDWEPTTTTWYIDGNAVFSEATPADMKQPMYLVVNLAVGGAGSWPGAPSSPSEFPAQLQIDYIHAYASPNTVNVSNTRGSISGKVFADANGNGSLGSGEPGLAGVTVTLLDQAGRAIYGATTTTDSNGAYSFGSLWAGQYEVKFTAPAGYGFDPQNKTGNPAVDSSPNAASGVTGLITLGAGQNNGTVNAGLIAASATVSGEVFVDADGDGMMDPGETGLAGITVTLLDASGAPIAGETAVTGSDGKYSFVHLGGGQYEVRFAAPAGYRFDPQNATGNPAVDSSPNATSGVTGVFGLAPGQTNGTVNAGLIPGNATVSGEVFADANASGTLTAGEGGLGGVTVTLLDQVGQPIAGQTVVTGTDGKYSFTQLSAGKYQVKFTAGAGYSFDPQNKSGNPAVDSAPNAAGLTGVITLLAGQVDGMVNAGLVTVSAGLSGEVFLDADGSGTLNAGDSGLSGVQVILRDPTGRTVAGATATTGSDGRYSFTNLAAGKYVVQFAAPSGFTFDPQNKTGNPAVDSGPNANGLTGLVTLSPGQTYGNVNAGLLAKPAPIIVYGFWQSVVTRGDGNFAVSGTAAGAKVTLGNGNQSISIASVSSDGSGGGGNIVTVGNGNSSIFLAGPSNTLVTGNGASTITMPGSYNVITVGGTPSGTTTVYAGGYAELIKSTGTGNVTVTGPTGLSIVQLADGNAKVTLGGSSNTVTVGNGNSTINSGFGHGTVHTGAGNSTITVTGWDNLLDAGAGTNFLNGGKGNDTFVLNGAGQGIDTITGFALPIHDVLDLGRTLASVANSVDLTNVGNYITATSSGGNTTLSVDTTGGHGTPSAFATLVGVDATVAQLVAFGDLRVP